ncbi:MAG: hypothetical protein ONB48_00780 [candidate division KSB1 bacterium]|nr:hypothetical protein [candidate division KSB1 bacterium]MDZ7272789.1 hypothetical protein [candidate division KSB1 bacterium]MDZ7284187.1 hypothetical protein [candidate division KSB1 bacterium]MDZ7297415.1 hypothetical protein [candidate division KSB1 bacterium]MDZ7306525.1 hypothetical protein [candidate division KSB1 bacterium]
MTTGGKIDPRSLWQLARRRKWFLIIPPLVALLGAYYRISTLPSLYRSETVIQIGNAAALSARMNEFVDGSGVKKPIQMRNLAEDLLAQLLSVDVLGEVVDRIKLKPSQGMLEEARRVQLEHPDESLDAIVRRLQIEWLARRFLDGGVTFAKRGSSMRIAFEHTDPDKAYLIVKTLADVFIEQNLERESKSAAIAIGFSKEQEQRYQQQYEEALERLRRLKEQTTFEQTRKLAVNMNNEAQANATLNSLQVDLNRQQDLLAGLEARLSGVTGNFSVTDTPRMLELRRRLLQKAEALVTVMIQFDWRDANVINVNQEIAALREQFREDVLKQLGPGLAANELELAAQHQIARLDLDLLRHEKKTLENLLETYRFSIAKRPVQEMQLAEAQKQVNDLGAVLYAFRSQAQRSELGQDLQKTSAEERFHIINPANRPLMPVPQDEVQILLIALFGGLGFGIGAVYLLEFFDHSFKSVEDVETQLGVPVLGVIPRIEMAEPARAKRPF